MRLGYLGEPFNVSDTIIVGGGFAGFGAAHTLKKLGINFKLITDEIAGGRNTSSPDGKVSYGTYWIGEDYPNTRKYMTFTRRMDPTKCWIYGKDKKGRDKTYTLPGVMIRYPLQSKKTIDLLKKFNKHYHKFRHNCELMPQKEAIEKDLFLKETFHIDSDSYLTGLGFTEPFKSFLEAFAYSIAFLRLEEISAYELLHWMKYFFIGTAHEFFINRDRVVSGVENNVVIDRVIGIRQLANGHYKVKTNKKTYTAKYIIMALPLEVTGKLLNLPLSNIGAADVHVWHVRGALKPEYSKYPYHAFQPPEKMCSIAQQHDGTFLIYTLTKDTPLTPYFDNLELIKRHHFKPAFRALGPLLNTKQGENLYLAGDFNVLGIEDSYISGIYAANQIAKLKG